jgi:hypothetical protein
LALDWRWGRETLCADGRHQILWKTNFVEGSNRSWDIATLDLHRNC